MKKQAFLEAAAQWYRDYKVAESYHQFSTFVESLKRPEHIGLIESVQTGINTLTESSGYNGDALVQRLSSLYEAAEDENEVELTDEEVADEMSVIDLNDESSTQKVSADADEGDASVGSLEQEEKKKKKTEKFSNVSDKSSLYDKYSIVLNSKSKRPEEQFMKSVAQMAIKQAEQFSNPDVQEEVFGHLLRWSLTQKKKLDEQVKSGERDPIDNLPAFIMKGTKPIFTKDKKGKPIVKKIQHSDLEKFKAGKKARGLLNFNRWKGSKPNYPHFVMHNGVPYELTSHGKSLSKGNKAFQMEPGTERADTIWEESTPERYKGAMAPVAMKSSMSLDSPVGDSGEGDMSGAETVAGEASTEFEETSTRQLTDRVLQEINSDKNKDKFKSGHLRLLNLIMNDPDKYLSKIKGGTIAIKGQELAELLPDNMPGISIKSDAGRPPRVRPESAKDAFKSLRDFLSSDEKLYKRYAGLRNILDTMDEIAA